MYEKIGGLLFRYTSKYIPPFDRSYVQVAAYPKKEAERIQIIKY